MDWRVAALLMGAFVLVEITVAVTLATKPLPSAPNLPPQILSATKSPARTGTLLKVTGQDPDSSVTAFEIDWGDGHTQRLTQACKTATGAPRYGGDTIRDQERHTDIAVTSRIRVRALARDCLQPSPDEHSPWALATEPNSSPRRDGDTTPAETL